MQGLPLSSFPKSKNSWITDGQRTGYAEFAHPGVERLLSVHASTIFNANSVIIFRNLSHFVLNSDGDTMKYAMGVRYILIDF